MSIRTEQSDLPTADITEYSDSENDTSDDRAMTPGLPQEAIIDASHEGSVLAGSIPSSDSLVVQSSSQDPPCNDEVLSNSHADSLAKAMESEETPRVSASHTVDGTEGHVNSGTLATAGTSELKPNSTARRDSLTTIDGPSDDVSRTNPEQNRPPNKETTRIASNSTQQKSDPDGAMAAQKVEKKSAGNKSGEGQEDVSLPSTNVSLPHRSPPRPPLAPREQGIYEVAYNEEQANMTATSPLLAPSATPPESQHAALQRLGSSANAPEAFSLDQTAQSELYNRAAAQTQRPNTPAGDLSVYSLHSGYAMAELAGSLPHLVTAPGVQQSPASALLPYHAQIPPHLQQALPGLANNSSYLPPQQPPAPSSYASHPAPMPPPVITAAPSDGKRKIHLRLVEDGVANPNNPPTTPRGSFLSFRRHSSRKGLSPHGWKQEEAQPQERSLERGRVTVSWYEGTTSSELQEHVRNSVRRKLNLPATIKLTELRILDEQADPPEEIVLSPYIPTESRLLLRFSTQDAGRDVTPPRYRMLRQDSYDGGAPESPSAAPSPRPSTLDLQGLGLSTSQFNLLDARLKGMHKPGSTSHKTESNEKSTNKKSSRKTESRRTKDMQRKDSKHSSPRKDEKKDDSDDDGSQADDQSTFEMQSLHPEDDIQKTLRQVTELQLLMMEQQAKQSYVPPQDKKQVIFTLANYFVLFLSLIAISAEIQARAPGWNTAIEQSLNSVKNCSKDQETLFECVSNGDMAGLVASIVLWLSRSAATKRIFLFGFDSPRKLWTVVYESLVTAVCWGFSYMFIRRGLNPDTSRKFLQRYWKDAVYGSLAGFNAAFLKHVLKNLIPQEAIEDALQDRQLKILSWLPSFA